MRVEENVLLKDFSTFRIGGPARYFIRVQSVHQMQEAIAFAKSKKVPYFILGRGSNILFDDKGYGGLVIFNEISFCHQFADTFFLGAGYSLASCSRMTANQGYAGMEFAGGIPASVGGALYMNAGAEGSSIADHVKTVLFLDDSLKLQVLAKNKISWGYRKTSFHQMKGAIISCEVELKKESKAKERFDAYLQKRKRTQPLDEYQAGCVFKNPTKEQSAGYLIEKHGWKNKRCGGAKVSNRHANFIVNENNATAKDVLTLMHQISSCIYEKTKISLLPEICYLSYWGQ